jgi:hypothetical protein
MRKIIGSVLAAGMLFGAGIAYADNLEGTVEEIDLESNMITVDGQTFDVSESTMSPGATLEELKEGDKVNVQFNLEGSGEDDDRHHALSVEKVAE